MSENRWLLTDVLRDEWGFDGVVVSDRGAVHDPRRPARAAGRPAVRPGRQNAVHSQPLHTMLEFPGVRLEQADLDRVPADISRGQDPWASRGSERQSN